MGNTTLAIFLIITFKPIHKVGSPWQLFLVHHQLNAANGIGENGVDGHRMFILQVGTDMLFLQPLQHHICGNIIVVCTEHNKQSYPVLNDE